MSTIQRTDTETLPIGAGVWRVDPTVGRLGFQAKSFWGLVSVKGHFSSYEGTLHLDDAGVANGELTLRAASLDTKNHKRDEHLRSGDFFNAEQHPTIRFSAAAVTSGRDGLTVTGDLHIGAHVARLRLPVILTRLGENRLRVQATTSVSREAVGLTWNKAGMIRGDVLLDVELDLVRAA